MKISADKQYLGTCIKCGNRGALLEGYCFDCRKKYPAEYAMELIAMGYDL